MDALRIPNKDNNNTQTMNQFQIISRKLGEFQTKFDEFKNGYANWVCKQSFPVECAGITAYNAILGAACGGLVGAVAQAVGNVIPGALEFTAKVVPPPMVEARTWAAAQATHGGIYCIMYRIRGGDDVPTRMTAGFGAGFTYMLLKEMGQRNVAGDAVMLGVFAALIGRVMFEVDQKNLQSPVEYTGTRCMLSNLGLQNYEKNFKKGLLTDTTMPFLTDSVLKEVGVPPGPRLLILRHIERDPELQKMREGHAG